MTTTDDAGAAPTAPAEERRISIRQLGKHLSAIMMEIEESGETLTVTREGRPVARLIPLPKA
jgi:prevent-host-death family protein